MRQSSDMTAVEAQTEGPVVRSRSGGEPPSEGRRAQATASDRNWLSEPKAAVWIILAAALLFGGGRKLLLAWSARRAVARLGEPDVTAVEIEAVAEHGRAGVDELLRIYSTSESEPRRRTAGSSLARLWFLDQLIAEEEKAIVRRGYTVNWSARRRYPRALRAEIPIVLTYHVPFLSDDGRRVGPSNLEWSHRVMGARRAALEEFSSWMAGDGRVEFSIIPGDFDSNGPHRLVLQTRVRTLGLTDAWAIELPQVPFQFEFDPILRLDAILSLADANRDESIARAIRLEPAPATDGEPTRYLALGEEWTIRNPPRLAVATPLPSDLAHTISIEIEGVSGRFAAGGLLMSGQGLSRLGSTAVETTIRRFDLGPVSAFPSDAIERPGTRQARIWIESDIERGWADPDIRSIWPGRTETNRVDIEIVRR